MDDSSPIILDSRKACADAARELILAADTRVCIASQALESEMYNDVEIYDSLTRLATSNRYADIRIIAHDTRVAANRGHYLIHLAQKLPTFVQIRVTVTRAHRSFRESWLMVDDYAYLRLRNPDRFEGFYEPDNKLECRNYLDEFFDMWETCEPDQNTRRLSL